MCGDVSHSTVLSVSNTADVDKMNDKRWSDTSDSTLVTSQTPRSPLFPPGITAIPKISGSIGKPPSRETPRAGPAGKPKTTSGLSRIDETLREIQNVDCDDTVLQAIQDRWEIAMALQNAVEEYREYRPTIRKMRILRHFN